MHRTDVISKKWEPIRFLLYVLLLSPLSLQAQIFQGRVFHEDTPLEGIIFFNQRSQQAAYSDAMGYFIIPASEGDSVLINSHHYRENLVIIGGEELKAPKIIVLKSKDINLEEVVVTQALEPKPFNTNTYSLNLNEAIKEDMKKHPLKYGKLSANGFDFIAMYKLIASLFKGKKKRSVRPKETLISASQIDSVFANNERFNDTFMKETLNITEEQKQLYFYYLENRGISKNLLGEDKELDLMEKLLITAAEFKALEDTADVKEE